MDRNLDRTEKKGEINEGQECCFAAGTLVRTIDGLKSIEDIKAGDLVLSYPDSQATPAHPRREDEFYYRRVTKVFITENQCVSKLVVSNYETNRREDLLVTENHSMYCTDKGWTSVADLRGLDLLENFVFGNVGVSRIQRNFEIATVYNFEIEDFHTYYVGTQGIWVHNACNSPGVRVRP